ncbi:MAG TPA: DUF2179 domain-containing protein [Gemmatimonadaceae bacterium]|nr:DUF2179 domain-containing protein [Gemmatimonadaceae bacterium]
MTPETTALFALPWGPFLIFGLRICDVSLDTMRVLSAVRGHRGAAAALGFFQALIWIFAVGNAIQHLNSGWHVFAYAAGFSTGTMVGITIERALAYGLSTVRIVSAHGGVEIAEALRDAGYGVTEMSGHGRDGQVEIINSVVQRQHLDDVMKIVDKWDPQAFITVEEPRVLRGGSIAGRRNLPTWLERRQRV